MNAFVPSGMAEPVSAFPVDRLSVSSADEFWNCPEDWRRNRILGEPRWSTGNQLFGSAFHKAVIDVNFAQKIESHEDLPKDVMKDAAGDSWNAVVEEATGTTEIRYYEDKPAKLQNGVIEAVVGTDSAPGYLQVLAPAVQPKATERWVETSTPFGVPLVGKIDVETDDGSIIDLKTGKKAKTQGDLDKSTQATAYLWLRQREGDPAPGFKWQTAIRTIKPQQQELFTSRTDRELSQFDKFLEMTVGTIRHYMDTYGPDEAWPGASPLAWTCSPTQCSHWPSCVWRGGSK